MSKKSMYLFVILGVIFLILGTFKTISIFPKQFCELLGGDYFSAGYLPGNYGCYFKATDAGKECTDSNQCQGRCEAKPISLEEVRGEVPATSPQGNCSIYTNIEFGCYTELKDGKRDKSVCVD